MEETNCANNSVYLSSLSSGKKRKNKNFKEDEDSKQIYRHRKSINSNTSVLSDKKSEISEGRRIDLDSDFESHFDYNTKSNYK